MTHLPFDRSFYSYLSRFCVLFVNDFPFVACHLLKGMPHQERYRLITFSQIQSMNNPQGTTPINGQMSYHEAPIIAPANCSRPRISELLEQKLHIDGSSLAKEAIFSCHKCKGPLVPSSLCPVCNRTSFRKCTLCKNEVPNGSHQLCDFLILLRELKANQHQTQKN